MLLGLIFRLFNGIAFIQGIQNVVLLRQFALPKKYMNTEQQATEEIGTNLRIKFVILASAKGPLEYRGAFGLGTPKSKYPSFLLIGFESLPSNGYKNPWKTTGHLSSKGTDQYTIHDQFINTVSMINLFL